MLPSKLVLLTGEEISYEIKSKPAEALKPQGGSFHGEQKKDSAHYCGRGFNGVRYRIWVSLCNVFTAAAGSDSRSFLGYSTITERNQDNR